MAPTWPTSRPLGPPCADTSSRIVEDPGLDTRGAHASAKPWGLRADGDDGCVQPSEKLRQLTVCSQGGFRESLWAERVLSAKLRSVCDTMLAAFESSAGARSIGGGECQAAEVALSVLGIATCIHLLSSTLFLQQLIDVRLHAGIVGTGGIRPAEASSDVMRVMHDCRRRMFREFTSCRDAAAVEGDLSAFPGMADLDEVMRSQPVMVWDPTRNVLSHRGADGAVTAGSTSSCVPTWWSSAIADRLRAALPLPSTVPDAKSGPGVGTGDLAAEFEAAVAEQRVLQDRALRAEQMLADAERETADLRHSLQLSNFELKRLQDRLTDSEGRVSSLRLHIVELQDATKRPADVDRCKASSSSKRKTSTGLTGFGVRTPSTRLRLSRSLGLPQGCRKTCSSRWRRRRPREEAATSFATTCGARPHRCATERFAGRLACLYMLLFAWSCRGRCFATDPIFDAQFRSTHDTIPYVNSCSHKR
eukprot:TRINITY_DN14270_c0_g1_i2.p1 TRINITY_DN14270_c0_g1~~TRINITY_DN14270_c0_g1_i2.p1  ORF type:complete len:476 (-),score=41.04 TRINITY_DN14270_c0_g1_i2:12-1439(-)